MLSNSYWMLFLGFVMGYAVAAHIWSLKALGLLRKFADIQQGQVVLNDLIKGLLKTVVDELQTITKSSNPIV